MTPRVRFIAFAVLAAVALPGFGQTPAHPEFELASIKLDSHCGPGGEFDPSLGRLRVSCIGVRTLIQYAYWTFADGAKANPGKIEILGGPAWLDSDSYDITAKAEGTAPVDQVVGPMLQTLLEDRYKLRVHKEFREIPVYALTVAKGGAARMQASKEGSCTPPDISRQPGPQAARGETPPRVCGGVLTYGNAVNRIADGHGMTMAQFAGRMLASNVDRPVIDKTGLTGLFEIHLEYVRDAGLEAPSPDASGPSIFTAIQEQLGLKLTPDKGSVQVLVIDHVERPSEN